MGNYDEVLNTIIDVLEHIQQVENEVREETKKRTIEVSKFLDEKNVTPSMEVLEGIQYQDILSQQLSATSDSMSSICKYLKRYLHAIESDSTALKDSIGSLDTKLKASLKEAKEKQKAFSGRVHHEDDDSNEEIEFF